MKSVRPIFLFWLFAALCIFAGTVKADTYDASTKWKYSGQVPFDYSTAQEAAAAAASTYTPSSSYTKLSGAFSNASCISTAYINNSAVFVDSTYNPTPTTHQCWGTGLQVFSSYICPYGGTISGATCINAPTCESGFDRNTAGQCVKNCIGKAGMVTTNDSYRFTGATSTWTVSGCRVACAVRVISPFGGTGSDCKYTGASALPDESSAEPLPPDPEKLPPEDPKDCTGQGMGYIQTSTGVKCVPSENAPEGQKPDKVESDTKKESGTPGTDGKPDPSSSDYKKEETTTVRNSDGTTTTTTKQTVNGTPDGNGGITCPEGFTANGTKCEKLRSTKQETSSFCAENPKDPTCKGTKSDDKDAECLENPDRISCKKLGSSDPGDGGDLPTTEIGLSSISPIGMASSNSCPSGTALPHGLGDFNWQPVCDYASAFKPLVILFAWLSAAFIVFGWKD